MGTAVLNALLKVVTSNPALLENVIEAAFTWLSNELKKANAANA